MLARAAKKPTVLTVLTFLAGLAVSIIVNNLPVRATADDATSTKSTASAPGERFFEMRTYIANEGKFEDLHKRFRDHTNRLFQKHGMELIGYWTPVADAKGEITDEAQRTLVYILAYPSREAREQSWKGFMGDPEWQAAYKESHKNGPLVGKVISQFLKPTDYSPIK
ncbi:MAG TPA: NIPSNAP family protein [Pirellulales bacterium]